MTKRMKILMGVAGVLVLALGIDRFVLNTGSTKPLPEMAMKLELQLQSTDKMAESEQTLLPKLSRFEEIWKRPLFTQNRTARATLSTTRTMSAKEAGKNTDQPPDFKIYGVAISPEGGAVILGQGVNEAVRILLNEEINGWRIEAINTEMVTLSKNGDRWQLPVGNEQ